VNAYDNTIPYTDHVPRLDILSGCKAEAART
jgi:hypothetical protein